MFSRAFLKSQAVPSTPPLRFPQKLWKIANECQSGAVCWSPDGKTILVRYSLFREEFMSTKSDFFKTDNISSFVRQLNLYGFRKVYEHAHKQAYKANPDLHEFSNSFFQRDRPELLDKVTRKSGALKERNDLWTENRKSTDILDEASCDKLWENINTIGENNDHTYLSSIRKNESSTQTSTLSALEDKIIDVVDSIHGNEKVSSSLPKNHGHKSDPEQINPLVPVRKKRGRKPGSKRNVFKGAENYNIPLKIYYSPVLKNPECYPNLIYFKDDDDSVYLRNTSRDVLLSSTMSFQETAEYLELKETYQRQHDSKVQIRYGLLF